MTSTFVVSSALCIIPPKEVWDKIQKIRAVHDKSYERWPPHINLIYPFIHNNSLPKHLNTLKSCVDGFKPFEISLKNFDMFVHKNSSALWLDPQPSEPICQIYDSLASKFVDPKKPNNRKFTPHLSVGQGANKLDGEKKLVTFAEDWEEIIFEVSSLSVITRNGNTPFELRYTIPFDGDVIEENVTIFPV